MVCTTYILYSQSLQRYYTGYTTQTIQERISYHLGNHKGFTAKAKDWVVIFQKKFENISEAIAMEKKIKKRGARRFLNDIQNLNTGR